jgi:hypothetical protein
MFAEDYGEVFLRFAQDSDINLLDERATYIYHQILHSSCLSVPRQSCACVESMSQPTTGDSTVNFVPDVDMAEGQGGSAYKLRREESTFNIIKSSSLAYCYIRTK